MSADPCNRRRVNAQDVLDMDWEGVYKIERKISEDLERFER